MGYCGRGRDDREVNSIFVECGRTAETPVLFGERRLRAVAGYCGAISGVWSPDVARVEQNWPPGRGPGAKPLIRSDLLGILDFGIKTSKQF